MTLPIVCKRAHVVYVGWLFRQDPIEQPAGRRTDRRARANRGVCGRHAMQRNIAECFAVVEIEHTELRFTKSHRALQHGVEDRFQFARRTGNRAEHLRGRGLLLKRPGKIVRALAQFIQQPRVLDRDHGLRGEIRDQSDLLVGEGAHLLAIDGDGADQLVLFEHRDAEIGASASKPCRGSSDRLDRPSAARTSST